MEQMLFTAAQMRELDRTAIWDRGIPSLELMEHAAQAVVQKVIGLAGGNRIGIFCGPGNNGGDGIAAAEILLKQGYEVRAFFVEKREKMTADARAMEERLLKAGGRLEPFQVEDGQTQKWLTGCHCMVDALFGVGLKRPIAGDFLAAVELMNRRNCPLVSCDIPSGVDTDTGEILGTAVRADWTVTFTCGKYGLYRSPGREMAGNVETASIGIPEELVRQMIGTGDK